MFWQKTQQHQLLPQCNHYVLMFAYIMIFNSHLKPVWGFPGCSDAKESTCNAGDPGSIPGSGRSPGEGNSNPTPLFLPGEIYGQRSLAVSVIV